MERAVRVGLLGCGNVGGALAELVATEGDAIEGRTGVRLEVTRVAVRDRSAARVPSVAASMLTDDPFSVVSDPDIDVVVELIGGVDPARELILAALAGGKPVVTANKELMARHWGEMFAAAGSAGVDLLLEAAVAGAVPLVRALRESLSGDRIRRVMGIVNGTTNYILTRMSDERVSYAEALAEAQELGFAEADPTADVGGHDAASKAAILATIAFGKEVRAQDVYTEGITGVSAADIGVAQRLGYEVKLLAVAEETRSPSSPSSASSAGAAGPAIAVRVHPAMLPAEHALAGVRGSFNAVFIEGESVGEMMLYGRGAGGMPTAAAVLGDLIDAAHNLHSGGQGRVSAPGRAALTPIDELVTQYFVSIDVADEPGVLAAVAAVFGDHDVSIRSMEQVGLGEEAHLIFLTHRAREDAVQATLAGLESLASVKRVGGLLRLAGVDAESIPE